MIHQLAFVEDALIGTEVFVWQFASVIRSSSIGNGTSIGPYTKVDGALIGHNCRIEDHCSINPGTVIGDGVFVGPGVRFCNDLWPSVDKEGFETPTRPTVIVEDDVSIGANAIILPGIRIGKGALVAAGARVERSIAPGVVYRRTEWSALQRPQDWQKRRMRYVA
jgi:acetyltransferase-like isoleucine patch superfamily enzyme